MDRRILHADMDAFYAAVEELDHPEWRTLPLVVGADPRKGQGRGVVSTCNYVARKFGIRSAMPVSRAYALCPQAIFVPPRMERYMEYSEQIMAIFRQYSPAIEPLSLDEAFLDCSGTERLFGDDATLARRIKNDVTEATGLTVSIGVSAVKFVAKIASDLRKPDGLVVVPEGTEKQFLAPLEIERLWGAGPRTCKQLKDAGIFTIGDLAARDPASLPGGGKGKHWEHLIALSRAQDPRNVESSRARKSIGEERTFFQDLTDPEELRVALLRLCRELAYRIRKTGFQGKTVTIKFRYTGFETHTRSQTQPMAVVTETSLRAIALKLWQQIDLHERNDRSIRLLGIQVSHADSTAQPDLFSSLYSSGEAESDQRFTTDRSGILKEKQDDSVLEDSRRLARDQKLESTMDSINEKFGDKLKRGI
ncbi:MAG TPA: DNA polymerase IV [Leptospiraceae bacterium]|nr:DNA polymerase IV [Spirochaetaceae bacterium]HBS03452.1 DNA polymerase IV [Leptospiraceae bacterium]|tara:strand:+ start:118397 stop:119659 length:1263 start_codon:yes stop_codon:yes gene_type:complete